jgi:hypothetical protein
MADRESYATTCRRYSAGDEKEEGPPETCTNHFRRNSLPGRKWNGEAEGRRNGRWLDSRLRAGGEYTSCDKYCRSQNSC